MLATKFRNSWGQGEKGTQASKQVMMNGWWGGTWGRGDGQHIEKKKEKAQVVSVIAQICKQALSPAVGKSLNKI